MSSEVQEKFDVKGLATGTMQRQKIIFKTISFKEYLPN